MITVGDVMNMRAFDSIWLATPCDGAAAQYQKRSGAV